MSRVSWLLLLLWLTTLNAVEGYVECYVCSWASNEKRDICTKDHFNQSVLVHTCEHGCESVAIFDKNGKFDNFYRNCASAGNSDGCVTTSSKSMAKEVCSCNQDYCNSSSQLEMLGGYALVMFGLWVIRIN